MPTFTTAELDQLLAAYLYPLFRFAALVGTTPLLSHHSVPRRVRVGLAVLVTLVVAPTLPAAPAVSPFTAPGVLLIIQQLMVGAAIGFAIQVAFAAIVLAGDMIGLQMGLSFAAFVDPVNSEQSPIVGSFLTMTLMLIFTAINGHLMVIAALVDSFNAVPISPIGWHWLDAWKLAATGTALFAYGLQIALPVIGAMLLTNLAFAILTRTAPQLNLFAVGFPVTLTVGLLILLLGLPQQIPVFETVLQHGILLFAR